MNQTLYFAIPGDLESRTGGYAYDRRMIAELQALGWQVAVVPLSPRFPSPDTAALREADSRLRELPDGATVLVDGLALGAMDGVAQAHTARLRLVGLCHHPLALESGLTQATVQELLQSERRALEACRAVLVTSPATAALVHDLFGIPLQRISVAVPGTDPSPFAACTGKPPVLLCVASITRRKGHDLLIEALSQLQHLEWQARFVGGEEFDPAWSQTIRAQTQSAGLTSRITLTGSQGSLEVEYLGADLFVLPTRFEGYGMVFTEALSYGLPVLATKISAVTDIVPEDAGLLVPTEDPDALASALNSLLTDAGLRQALAQGARKTASGLPRWRDSAGIISALLHDVQAKENR